MRIKKIHLHDFIYHTKKAGAAGKNTGSEIAAILGKVLRETHNLEYGEGNY
jgi:hypothetical protein